MSEWALKMSSFTEEQVSRSLHIELAFEYVKMCKYTYLTIFSNALSCLQSLHSMNTGHQYILDTLYNYNHCDSNIPSHIGIHGNNEADKVAKSALDFDIVKLKIPSTGLKHFIKLYINSLWQI